MLIKYVTVFMSGCGCRPVSLTGVTFNGAVTGRPLRWQKHATVLMWSAASLVAHGSRSIAHDNSIRVLPQKHSFANIGRDFTSTKYTSDSISVLGRLDIVRWSHNLPIILLWLSSVHYSEASFHSVTDFTFYASNSDFHQIQASIYTHRLV